MGLELESKIKYPLLVLIGVTMVGFEVPKTWALVTSVLLASWLAMGGHKVLYLMYHTLGRDLRAARFMICLLLVIRIASWRNWTVPQIFSNTAKKSPKKVMFYFEDQKWTFEDVDKYSNKVANFFLERGYKRGDVIGLFMENRPEYACIWLGIAKAGIVPALINNQLKKQSLSHTFTAADVKAIVYGEELEEPLLEVIKAPNGTKVYPSFCNGLNGRQGLIPGTVDLDKELNDASDAEVPEAVKKSVGFQDVLLYIYTSGTTGLPKAAVIKHSRFIISSGGCRYVIGIRPDDILYSPLPQYHTVTGMLAMSATMRYGVSMVMRHKFSATNYWKDCKHYDVTVAQYIGEICRFLLKTPEIPEEKEHHVRLMFGNGLRPQIWQKFVTRFNVPKIAEFYGSTEGNSNIINYENVIGAVGFVSVLLPTLLPLGLIKVDRETGKEVRDPNTGLCIRCKPGETGELVGLIVKDHPVRDFVGYKDTAATNKKLLQSVWRHNDTCFRSGDLLVSDELGWLYFVDRIGDTFRWRGENVSTAEVEGVLSNLVQLRDVAVYGVEIPGIEGRAGMAAIFDPNLDVDIEQLSIDVHNHLPNYSRPLFLRILSEIDVTGTFKLRKVTLKSEGFNPTLVNDKMYFLHPSSGKYVLITTELYESILNGKIRL